MKRKTCVFITAILSLIVSISCLFICDFSDIVSISCYGFGLDSSGVLYLGMNDQIVKYQGQEKISSIPILFRAYAFEIRLDDTILCSDAKDSYVMNLEGRILQVIEKTGSKEYNRILSEKKAFIANDGQEYGMSTPFGRRVIKTRDGVIIWKTPIKDYLIHLIGFISLSILMGCAVIIIYHFRMIEDWTL